VALVLATACSYTLTVSVRDLVRHPREYSGRDVRVSGTAALVSRKTLACAKFEKQDTGDNPSAMPQGPSVEVMEPCVVEKWSISEGGVTIQAVSIGHDGPAIRAGAVVTVEGTWVEGDEEGVLNVVRVRAR
jgi:hypothetical protein